MSAYSFRDSGASLKVPSSGPPGQVADADVDEDLQPTGNAEEDATIPEEELRFGSIAGRAGTDLFSGDGTSNVDMLSLTANDTTRDRLESAFTEGRAVVAGIMNDPLSSSREGLSDAHSYTVLGYDRATDTVTLRNPHGYGEHEGAKGQVLDGVSDGVFTLTVDELNRLFTNVTYANAPFASEE